MIPAWVLNKASNMSCKSDMTMRHVCLIVLSKKIISIGVNKHGTNRFAIKNGYVWSLHAEAMAIQKMEEGGMISNAHRYKMYIMRFSKQGELMPSEPCDRCKQLIESSGIKKVIWS